MFIKALVFEGGGVLGTAYAGAVDGIEDHLHTVDKVMGTSAGSIVALLIAIGYYPAEIKEGISGFKYDKILSYHVCNIFRFFRKNKAAIFSTRRLRKEILKLMKLKGFDEHTTFKHLHNLGAAHNSRYKSLYVTTYAIEEMQVHVFSKETSPDAKVLDAVVASSSIPCLFELSVIDGIKYVDGGISKNYNIGYFDNLYKHDEVLGFKIDDPDEMVGGKFRKVNNGWDVLMNTIETAVMATNDDHLKNGNMSRTVLMSSLDIPFYDFNISDADKARLIEEGSRATKQFLTEKI